MINYIIKHDLPGRIRLRVGQYALKKEKAYSLQAYISSLKQVDQCEVNCSSGSILIYYHCSKEEILAIVDQIDLDALKYDSKEIGNYEIQQREIKNHYFGEFGKLVAKRYLKKWFLPVSIRNILIAYDSLHFIYKGLQSLGNGKIDVPVLDATSISVSMLNNDFNTAGDIIFLLKVSGLLEDYTKKKTTLELKENLSVKIDQIWVEKDGSEILMPMEQVQLGDIVIIQTGTLVPIDGEIVKGNALINEASFTGEPLSKPVEAGDSVFAGTVIEEGKIYVSVRKLQSDSRINKIVDMIDTNEALKASIQANAEHLADSIVPFSFAAFFGMLLFTRNLTKASAVLMVDYSCAIKLSTSVAIISAMQEASKNEIIVKGGKFLETVANTDTIVFDKTGTLTNATPQVQKVIPFGNYIRDDVLMISACLEEHFPHSVARAITKQAEKEGIYHKRELHSEVKYIIAHGIASSIHGQDAIIGSDHFVFEDENIPLTPVVKAAIEELETEGANSFIYLAIGGELAGIISIYDPVKDEAIEVISKLKKQGIKNIVMLTGDGKNAAKHIAEVLGITEYHYNVLPEQKAAYIQKLKDEGKTVIMVGDGVNDTPALSVSDASISLQDSSDIARELADITLVSSSLKELNTLRDLSVASMNRIHANYRFIVGFNTMLIVLGIMGVLPPSTSALLHNASTFGLSAFTTRKLLK